MNAPQPIAAPHGSTVTLDVTLHWKQDLIATRHLDGTGIAAVGQISGAMAPIPCGALGREGFVFARLEEGKARVSVPEGGMATHRGLDGGYTLIEGPSDEPLQRGESIELRVGAFLLCASASEPERIPCAAPLVDRTRLGAWLHVGVAAVAHALVLGLAAHAAMASELDDNEEERTEEIRQLMVSAEQRARAVDETVERGFGSSDGGDVNKRFGDGRAAGGERAAGSAGAMGDRDSRSAEHRRYAVAERVRNDPSPAPSRQEALKDAAAFGMIGLLAEGAPATPAAWFGEDEAHGVDPISARGELWASALGSHYAPGGLELKGIGDGGGGRGEGIGLGSIGLLGHRDGPPGSGTGGGGGGARLVGRGGSWGGSWSSGGIGHIGHHRVKPPRVWWGDGVSVSGRLPPEAVQRIIRQNFGRFRFCYEKGLVHAPALEGRVAVRFVIGRDGSVSSVGDGGSSMPDPAVVSCVVRAFYGLSFPQPEGGIVTVTYPIVFSSAE
jgi:hypothetical protein